MNETTHRPGPDTEPTWGPTERPSLASLVGLPLSETDRNAISDPLPVAGFNSSI